MAIRHSSIRLGNDGRHVRRCIEELLADPNQRPDAERRSPRDRNLRVKYAGRHCVLYWLDSFVRELRIVEIEEVRLR